MKSDTGYYEDCPFAVEFYDHTPFIQSMSDLDFWRECAGKYGGPALELASGTGRVLLQVARDGFEVVGLDASARMLNRCRERLEDEPDDVRDRVRLVEASMDDFRIDREFALIYSPFRSFQVLMSVERQLNCLTLVRDHLKPGGHFVLDVFDPHMPFLTDETRTVEWGRGDEFAMPDGRRVEVKYRNHDVDFHRQTIGCEQIFYVTHPDGRAERLVQTFQLRYFHRYELEHLLVRAGFALVEMYGGFDKRPPGVNPPGELLAVARKA